MAAAPARASVDVRAVGDPPARMSAGSALTVGDLVVNAGRSRSRPAWVTYWLSAGGSRYPLGRRLVGALARRGLARERTRVTVPSTVPPGAYRLRACVAARCHASRGVVVVVAVVAEPPPTPVLDGPLPGAVALLTQAPAAPAVAPVPAPVTAVTPPALTPVGSRSNASWARRLRSGSHVPRSRHWP